MLVGWFGPDSLAGPGVVRDDSAGVLSLGEPVVPDGPFMLVAFDTRGALFLEMVCGGDVVEGDWAEADVASALGDQPGGP